MPIAKTPKGIRIDGTAIVELAAAVKKPMDANSWSDDENLDRYICKRSHQGLIQSLIASKASETETKGKNSVDDFAKLCALQDEIAKFRGHVRRVVRPKMELVKIERNLEEEKGRRMEAEKRKEDKAKKIQETRSEMEKQYAKSREEAEIETEIQKDLYFKIRKELKFLEKQLCMKKGGWLDVIGPAIFRQTPDEEKFSDTPETGGGKGTCHEPSESWFNVIIQTLTVVNGFVSNVLQIREINICYWPAWRSV